MHAIHVHDARFSGRLIRSELIETDEGLFDRAAWLSMQERHALVIDCDNRGASRLYLRPECWAESARRKVMNDLETALRMRGMFLRSHPAERWALRLGLRYHPADPADSYGLTLPWYERREYDNDHATRGPDWYGMALRAWRNAGLM